MIFIFRYAIHNTGVGFTLKKVSFPYKNILNSLLLRVSNLVIAY